MIASHLAGRASVPAIALLAACAAPPESGELTQTLDLVATDDLAVVDERFVARIDGAADTLHVAIPQAQDTALSDALIAAHDRGVLVEVVTDVDQVADPGIAALVAAEIPVTLADGHVGYFDFSSNADVGWASTETIMSHAFVVADGTYFTAATTAGSTSTGAAVIIEGHSEDLSEDLRTEHNQVFGGIDATALTAYSSMAKSIADFRWKYGTDHDAQVELWFGPQERVVKRLTDGVFGARARVWVLTDDISDEGFIRALQEKAADGFEVTVIVGPSFGDSESRLSRILEDEAPDVTKLRTTMAEVPTLVIVDHDGGGETMTRVFVATHDIYSAGRFFRGDAVRTDQLIDGTLFVVDDWGGTSPLVQPAVDLFQSTLDTAEAL